MRAEGADLGLAFDGDADRCFVVDENGTPVSPSAVTALGASRELARYPGATVIRGAVVGAAVGDALGGQTAVLVADSLPERDQLDVPDIFDRFQRWTAAEPKDIGCGPKTPSPTACPGTSPPRSTSRSTGAAHHHPLRGRRTRGRRPRR